MDGLKQREGMLDEFDEKLWLAIVEMVTVHSESEMTVKFRDGVEIQVDIETR